MKSIYKLKQDFILVFELSKRDFQQQYQGSYLGFLWVFLQPLIYFTVLYLVFTVGFRQGTNSEIPFELYLITGMISWLFFSGTLSSTTNVIRSYSFLVKKVDFKLGLLPIVKIFSALGPHIFFIFIAMLLCWVRGYPPTLYSIQVFYYLVAMVVLLIGLGWLTSATNVFIKDISNLVAITVQFGFWLTPIFWNLNQIPVQYQWIIKINPVYYIVTGYRDSLIAQIPFWQKPIETLYFWSVTLVILIIGLSIFRRLKPHFAEVI